MSDMFDEDEETLAASERHSQIMEDGELFFRGVFFAVLLTIAVLCGAAVGFFAFGGVMP